MVLAVSYALNAQQQTPSGREGGRRIGASPSQKRLAEITEMIHTASLFHDDVIDKVIDEKEYFVVRGRKTLNARCFTVQLFLFHGFAKKDSDQQLSEKPISACTNATHCECLRFFFNFVHMAHLHIIANLSHRMTTPFLGCDSERGSFS